MINLPLRLGKTVINILLRPTAAEDNQCGEPMEIPPKIIIKKYSSLYHS